MSKVTLLCSARRLEETVVALQDLGVVHLSPLHPRDSESVEKARHRLEAVRKVLEVLPKPTSAGPPSGRAPEALVEEISRVMAELKQSEESRLVLDAERQRLAPFGNFDPESIKKLAGKDVVVRLYQAGLKQEVEIPPGLVRIELSRDKTSRYFVVLGSGPVNIGAQELRRPEASLREIEDRIQAAEKSIVRCRQQMQAYARDHAALEGQRALEEERFHFQEARAGMGRQGPVGYLSGYCPRSEVESLRRAAIGQGWGLRVEDPVADDPVPTLISNPRWIRPIQAIFDVIGITPGYREIDISACFLLFFSLFFAMLVGDAGYGALFIVLTWWFRKKFPTAPAYPFSFMYIMSGATVLWGVLTGNYFGIAPAPSPLAPLQVKWLTNPENIKLLCFIIGTLHLTVAHLWNIVRMRSSLQALAQVGWLCTTWTMFFFAWTMVLDQPFPRFLGPTFPVLDQPFPKIMGPVFLVGVAAIVLFMTPLKDIKNEWFNHAMLPLNLVSNFVDVVSYIRLFAVGTASFAVANSFNTMLGGLFNHWFTGLLAAVFLFAAHVFNIVLSLMGVMVHGVRLNTLEFSGHIGMQWTGIPYQPFRRTAQPRLAVGDADLIKE